MSKRYKVILFLVICSAFVSMFFIFTEEENAIIMGIDGKHVSDMYPQYQDHQDETEAQDLSNGDFEAIMYEHFSINQVNGNDNPEMKWNSTSGNVDIWNQYYYDAVSGEQYVAISQDYIYHYIDQQFSNGQKVRYSFDHAHGGDSGNASLVFELVNLNGETLYTSDFYNVYEDQEWTTHQGEYTFTQDVSGVELKIKPTGLSALNLVDDVNFSYATAPTFSNNVMIDAKKINNQVPTTVNTSITRIDDFSDTQWTNQSLEVILPPGSVLPTTAYATYSDGTTSELSISPTGPNTFIIYGFKDVYFDDVVISFETIFADTELETAEIITNYKYTAATSVGNDVNYNVYGIDIIEMMNSYELTFDPSGATNNYETTTRSLTPGAKISDPEIELTREGYRFVGWSTSIDGSTGIWDFNTNIMPPRDTTMYAIWELDTYTVKYDINGGDLLTVPSSQIVISGQYIANPISPFSMGGTFAGWNTSSDGTGTMWDFNTMPMPSSDLTLYAQWTPFSEGQSPSYSVPEMQVPTSAVYIDPNYDDLMATGQVYPVGTVISQPTNISRPGYTLVGFSTTPNAESGLWDFGTNQLTDSSYTLYAQWLPESMVTADASNEVKEEQFEEAISNDYTVSFVYEGASDSDVVNYGTYLTMPKVPEKTGYTFTGWMTNTGQAWEFNSDFVTTDVRLYPQYEVISYDVYYDGFWYGEYEYGSMVTPIYPQSIPGYEFIGWTANGEDEFDGVMPSYDLMLTSMWKISEYEVQFIDDDITTEIVVHNHYVAEPPHQEVPGTEFVGWNTSADGSGVMWNFDTMPITKDLDLYPIYVDVDYSHTFMNKNSSYEVISYYNQVVIPPTNPVMSGYTFLGWSTSVDGRSGVIDFNNYLAPAADVVLYPVWSVNSYTLNYDVQGGTTSYKPKSVKYGEVLTVPQTPTKKGYTFLGWSYDVNGNERVDFNYDTMPASNRTIYAQWGTKPVSVDFVINGYKVGTYYYEKGDYMDPPEVDVPGYEIIGWTTNLSMGTMWNFEKTPIGDQSLVFNAILEPVPVTVTYHYENNKEILEAYEYGEIIVVPTVNPSVGYEFVGWSLDGQNVLDVNTYQVTEDIDLYPVFNPVHK